MKTSSDVFQQCYNAQTVVDDTCQLVVATASAALANNQGQLVPKVDAVTDGYGTMPKEALSLLQRASR